MSYNLYMSTKFSDPPGPMSAFYLDFVLRKNYNNVLMYNALLEVRTVSLYVKNFNM